MTGPRSTARRARGATLARALLLAAVLPAVLAPAARGQVTYELTDRDVWAETDRPEPGTPAAELATIREAIAEGRPERAKELADQWIDAHERDPLLPEAYLLRGDALAAQRSYYKALFDYEYVARVYPGSDVFVRAAERELEIATLFARGLKRKQWGLRWISAKRDAEELLIRIQERLPGSQIAERAGLELADYYFRERNMPLAVEAYDLFVQNYPRSEHVSTARRRLIYAYLATFKGPEFDASGLYEAKVRLEELKTIEPFTAEQVGADALIRRIEETDARKMLTTARWYTRVGDWVSAERTIRRLVLNDDFAGTAAYADALRAIASIRPRLPASVLEDAPDYDLLRRAVLGAEAGDPPARTETRPATAPDGTGEDAP